MSALHDTMNLAVHDDLVWRYRMNRHRVVDRWGLMEV